MKKSIMVGLFALGTLGAVSFAFDGGTDATTCCDTTTCCPGQSNCTEELMPCCALADCCK